MATLSDDPSSEQIIDALLEEDESRYETYRSVRAEADVPRTAQGRLDEAAYDEKELFLAEWLRLERLVRDVAGPTKEYVPLYRMLGNLRLVDPDMRFELNQLRRIRNQLVHGIEVPSLGQLRAATERLSALISEIERRHGRE
jgi:hypothetical protein